MNPEQPPLTVKRPLAQNRRSSNRHRLSIPATLQLEGDQLTPIPVIVTEISIGGIGIRSAQPLLMDRIHLVSSFDTLLPPGMRVRPVSERQAPDGTFEVGAKIV